MKLSDFDYQLPKELIAQEPCLQRDESRLLVVDRKKQTFKENTFRDIAEYLDAGDCLVFNDTKVMPARLFGKRPTGGKAEVLLYERIDKDRYKVLLKPGNKIEPGDRIYFNEKFFAEIGQGGDGSRLATLFSDGQDVDSAIEAAGEMPLPPYIKRRAVDADLDRYQTVYARHNGACAAPTAGLHFTQALLDRIAKRGVRQASVTLHVSYGTFAPVKTERIEDHKMHKEYFVLPKETADMVKNAKDQKKSVVAVGTTSMRVLETCARDSDLGAREGWTDLFVYEPYEFKAVDKLITNFHVPKSTLLFLVSAFAGKELIFKAYEYAIKEKFRFFSYGDAMLII